MIQKKRKIDKKERKDKKDECSSRRIQSNSTFV